MLVKMSSLSRSLLSRSWSRVSSGVCLCAYCGKSPHDREWCDGFPSYLYTQLESLFDGSVNWRVFEEVVSSGFRSRELKLIRALIPLRHTSKESMVLSIYAHFVDRREERERVGAMPEMAEMAEMVEITTVWCLGESSSSVSSTECAICMESVASSNIVSMNCGHRFCAECVATQLTVSGVRKCALCRAAVSTIEAGSYESYRKISDST